MAALNLDSATRVFLPPEGGIAEGTSVPFGDDDVVMESLYGDMPVVDAGDGWFAMPTDTDDDATQISTSEFAPPQQWTIMVAVDMVAAKSSPSPYIYGDWCGIVGSTSMIVAAKANDIDLMTGDPTLATALGDGVSVLFLTSNASESFYGTSLDGVINTGAAAAAVEDEATFYVPVGAGYPWRLRGIWMWEGQDVSQADALATAQVIVTEITGAGGGGEVTLDESTVGPEYTSALIRGLIGPVRGPLIPDTIWGGWMDDTGQVLAWTGIEVDHDAFGPAADGVWNNVSVDAGYAPAGTLTRFGIFDAAVDGKLIIFAEVAFPEGGTPSEGDPVQFPPGALKFVAAPTVEPTPPLED